MMEMKYVAHDSAFSIGPWLVQPAQQCISNGSEVHRLEPRIMLVLVRLAEQPGEVVTRDALLDDVWGDVVVNEDALTRAVSDLRKLLGDDAAAPQYIETIRGVGYRLVAPVASGDGATTPVQPLPAAEGPRKDGSRYRLMGVGAVLGLIAGVSIWILLGGGSPPDTLPLIDAAPFTSYPGFERDPALSPDGSRVAYAWGDDFWTEAFDLYVKQRNTETPLQLTHLPGYEANPAWSPDGSTVAFTYLDPQGHSALYSVPGLGGPPRKLYEAASYAFGLDWSPDGRTLVFAERSAPGAHSFRIMRLSLASLEARALTDPSGSESDYRPSFSPDGRRVAFVRSTPTGAGDVFVMPAEGGTASRLTHLNATIQGLDWRAEGRQLFVLTQGPGTARLWQVARSNGAAVHVPTTSRTMTGLSAAAGKLVFEEAISERTIWMKPLGRGPDASATPFLPSTQWDGQAVFSPDGRSVAFTSSRSGHPELWVAGADGSTPAQLTHLGGAAVARPRWAPDGSRIAFYTMENGVAVTYVVPAAGGRLQRLSDPQVNAQVTAWSHDGRWVYLASDRNGSWQIWKMPAAGGKAVQVTTEGGFTAAESSDGRWLYVTRMDEDGLWRLHVNGGAAEKVWNRPMRWAFESWGVQGSGVYYLDVAAGARTVRYLTPGEPTSRVLAGLPERRLFSSINLAPDGSSLLFSGEVPVGSDLTMADVR